MELARTQLKKLLKKINSYNRPVLSLNDTTDENGDEYKEISLEFVKKCKMFNKLLEVLPLTGLTFVSSINDGTMSEAHTDHKFNWKTSHIWIELRTYEDYIYYGKEFDSDWDMYISGYYRSIPEFIKPFIIDEMPENRRHLFR